MNDGKLPSPCTKETREYARHLRCLRDVRRSQISLFSSFSRMNHSDRVCAMSWERQGQQPVAHVKRVTLQVITAASAVMR